MAYVNSPTRLRSVFRIYGVISELTPRKRKCPLLIDLRWGDPSHKKITLIGKGVCFDTGGYDLKPSQHMRQMKKDMGGAALVIGLAKLIMQLNLPVRLRVLIPAVENVISGNAYKPGDVLNTRKGLTVEVGNTDAEGRVILADAITYACEESPDLIIDCATLTGAARIALGAEIPVLFSNNDKAAEQLLKIAKEQHDPLWQLPLHQPYKKLIDSPIANLTNSATTSYGGAITAALFLQSFLNNNETPWIHLDMMAWNNSSSPGRPEGGEAMGLRSLLAFIEAQV